MATIFKCLRCGKTFPTQKALTIHSEVRREDGVIAILLNSSHEPKTVPTRPARKS